MVRHSSGTQTVNAEAQVHKDDHGKTQNNKYGNDQKSMNGNLNGNNSNAIQVSAMFYITNFLDRLLFVDLKKSLEVCGILSDIYLSRFRNVRGQQFALLNF